MRRFLFLAAFALAESAGAQTPLAALLQSAPLRNAHAGICVYDDSLHRFLVQAEDDKYFTPASNTKIASLYAGLSLLGDSLPSASVAENDTALFVFPAGDPTFLHPAYAWQPLLARLRATAKKIWLVDTAFRDQPFGEAWVWDDYSEDYNAERSALPVYGNCIAWWRKPSPAGGPATIVSRPRVPWPYAVTALPDSHRVVRRRTENIFDIAPGAGEADSVLVPFITDGLNAAALLLADTLGRPVSVTKTVPPGLPLAERIRSQPVDSLFTPMMHESDNFFAEQTLLMAGNLRFGTMNDAQIQQYLLKGPLSGFPQAPSWVDGSGLSRLDLFTPRDFVWLLGKLKNEFGLARIEHILPGAGEGTLKNYYLADKGFIFAKTGTLTGAVALSGYLHSSRNHLLIFSVLVNNFVGRATPVRREIEKFIESVRKAN